MGYIFTDLVVQTVLEEGLADLRANLDDRLNILLSQLKESYFNAEYGQQELDRFKTYLTNNRIEITQSWRDIAERVPCINIQTVAGPEDISRAVIQDYAGDQDYYIGNDPNQGIESRYEKRMVPIKTAVQISVHVDDPGGPTALRWLYACVLYWLVSRKNDLVNRGLNTTTWDSSDFNRLNEFLPENIYSRYLTLLFTNDFEFEDISTQTIIDNIDIYGDKDSTYNPNDLSGGVKVPSGSDPEFETNSAYTISEY